MKTTILTIFFLFTQPKYAQIEYEALKIVLNRIEYNNSHILQCEKEKFVFVKQDYDGDMVSSKVLNELEEASKKKYMQYTGKWCISCIHFSKWKKKQRKILISVSSPIFDNEKEHCVIAIKIMRKKNSTMGMTYMLRRIKNEWIIIEVFDIWIT